MNTDQMGFFLNIENQPNTAYLQLDNLITDRGSKYSVTAGKVESDIEIKELLTKIKSEKKYSKATHNSYAARFVENGKIIETKSDDKETGAGMVILRCMRKANIVNSAVVVTRWFGGTMLYNDRFKHIQDASNEVLRQIK